MNDIAFSCPWCDQHFKSQPDMARQAIACPSCGKEFKVPDLAQRPRHTTGNTDQGASIVHFPIIIHASTRALYSKYLLRAIALAFGLILVIGTSRILKNIDEQGMGEIMPWIWRVFVLICCLSLARLWLDYRRIKHTEYRIFSNKIEASSYTFRFLGAFNNVISLTKLNQIQAFRNSLLDLWFFGCGGITLTVSGDIPDFVLLDIHIPEIVRQQIEEIAFGKDSVDRTSNANSHVSHEY